MSEWIIPGIATVVVSSIASLVTYASVRVSRRDQKVDEAATITDLAMSLVEPLKASIAELQQRDEQRHAEVVALRNEVQLLHRWAQALRSQLVGAKIEPIGFDEIQLLGD